MPLLMSIFCGTQSQYGISEVVPHFKMLTLSAPLRDASGRTERRLALAATLCRVCRTVSLVSVNVTEAPSIHATNPTSPVPLPSSKQCLPCQYSCDKNVINNVGTELVGRRTNRLHAAHCTMTV